MSARRTDHNCAGADCATCLSRELAAAQAENERLRETIKRLMIARFDPYRVLREGEAAPPQPSCLRCAANEVCITHPDKWMKPSASAEPSERCACEFPYHGTQVAGTPPKCERCGKLIGQEREEADALGITRQKAAELCFIYKHSRFSLPDEFLDDLMSEICRGFVSRAALRASGKGEA